VALYEADWHFVRHRQFRHKLESKTMARAKHIKRKASDKARRALIRYNLQNPDTGVISTKITSAYTGGNGARANIGIPQCSTVRGSISSNVVGQMRSVAMSPKTKLAKPNFGNTFQGKAMRGYAKRDKLADKYNISET